MISRHTSLNFLLNSLPNDKILDWSKMKALADDKIDVTQKLTFWEKEKVLVTSTFSISKFVCKSLLLGC